MTPEVKEAVLGTTRGLREQSDGSETHSQQEAAGPGQRSKQSGGRAPISQLHPPPQQASCSPGARSPVSQLHPQQAPCSPQDCFLINKNGETACLRAAESHK